MRRRQVDSHMTNIFLQHNPKTTTNLIVTQSTRLRDSYERLGVLGIQEVY